MPITRSSDQRSKTLEEFYQEVSEGRPHYDVDPGKGMLDFIQLINQIFKQTLIWGLTSHYRLVLQSADDYKSPWYVIVVSIGTKEYYFEYLMPLEKQPWPHAYVRGEAKNIEEAKRYLLIAMYESGGWAGNSELMQLMHDNNIKGV